MDEQLLSAKVKDALRLCSTTGMFKAVGFLSTTEASFIHTMPQLKNQKFAFYGGYDDAERVYFVALPDWCDDVAGTGIVESFTFTYRKCDKLTHRDFLGTLMSLGLTREAVGDILCEEGRTVVFVSGSISSYISGQIQKVGGVGVSVTSGFTEPLPCFAELKEFTDTVASLRLDSVVASLLNTSREKAKVVIAEKRVSVDSVICDKPTFTPNENSKISIKGVGKFILAGASQHTKKGRLILNYKKYV